MNKMNPKAFPMGGGGGCQGLELVAEVELLVASSLIQFLGLDLDEDTYYFIFFRIKDNDVGGTFRMQYNNDAVQANYDNMGMWAQAGAHGNTGAGDASIRTFGSGENIVGTMTIQRDIDGYPRAVIDFVMRGSEVIVRQMHGHIRWVNANVTRIDFVHGGVNGFAIGSRVIIYRYCEG